jgi:hypothetical protein
VGGRCCLRQSESLRYFEICELRVAKYGYGDTSSPFRGTTWMTVRSSKWDEHRCLEMEYVQEGELVLDGNSSTYDLRTCDLYRT